MYHGKNIRMLADGNGAYVPLPTKDAPSTVPDPAAFDSDGEEAIELELTLNEVYEDIDEVTSVCSRHQLRFVENYRFHYFSACVVFMNILLIVYEEQHHDQLEEFRVCENLILCFYVFELFCRWVLYQQKFLCGPRLMACWNLLDLVVVVAGVIDQWLFKVLEMQPHGYVKIILKFLRMLRFFRMLKIIRLLLEADLQWAERPRFQTFIGLAITFNALLMGCETDYKWKGWALIENVLLIIYTFELVVQLKRHGWFYLSWANSDFWWNLLDFTIVASSVADAWLMPLIKVICNSGDVDEPGHRGHGIQISQVMMLMRLLRLMRILRLVKLVKSVRPLYILVTSVAAAVQGVFWVLILTVVSLYALGILATRLIGHGVVFKDEIPSGVQVFSSVPNSMFTLFRVMSGAQSSEESEAIDDLMREVPTIKCAFVFFMVFASWTLLSILTAVVSENMISTTAGQEAEMRLQCDEEDRIQHMQELRTLFEEVDKDHSGAVDLDELVAFISNKENARRAVKSTRVPTRNVVEVIKTLGRHGKKVDIGRFLECMLDVSKPVTEQSIMRLEAQLRDVSAMVENINDQQRSLQEQMAGVLQLSKRVSALEAQAAIKSVN